MPKLVTEPTVDAELLAELHAETVRFAYAGFFPADSPPPTAEELEATWADRLDDPTATAFVVREAGAPVGSVMVRRDPDFAGEGQVVGLHVRPGAWGRGVGSALHDGAADALVLQGYRDAGLWVIAANERARRMYVHRGWELVPDVGLHLHGVTEVRYRLVLAARSR